MLSTIVTSSLAGICCADGPVDVIAEQRRLLDARPGLRPHVDLELSRIDRRKEVLSQRRRQQRQRSQSQKPRTESGTRRA